MVQDCVVDIAGKRAAGDALGGAVISVLFILDDPPYGSERV